MNPECRQKWIVSIISTPKALPYTCINIDTSLWKSCKTDQFTVKIIPAKFTYFTSQTYTAATAGGPLLRGGCAAPLGLRLGGLCPSERLSDPLLADALPLFEVYPPREGTPPRPPLLPSRSRVSWPAPLPGFRPLYDPRPLAPSPRSFLSERYGRSLLPSFERRGAAIPRNPWEAIKKHAGIQNILASSKRVRQLGQVKSNLTKTLYCTRKGLLLLN